MHRLLLYVTVCLFCPTPSSLNQYGFDLSPHPPQHLIACYLMIHKAWQGTDLMHNHVLAENSLTVAEFPCSDQSEDSDYESIWTSQNHRTASFSRKMPVLQTMIVLANKLTLVIDVFVHSVSGFISVYFVVVLLYKTLCPCKDASVYICPREHLMPSRVSLHSIRIRKNCVFWHHSQ